MFLAGAVTAGGWLAFSGSRQAPGVGVVVGMDRGYRLGPGDPVFARDIKVGQVDGLELVGSFADTRPVQVRFRIYHEYAGNIRTSAIVTIGRSNIIDPALVLVETATLNVIPIQEGDRLQFAPGIDVEQEVARMTGRLGEAATALARAAGNLEVITQELADTHGRMAVFMSDMGHGARGWRNFTERSNRNLENRTSVAGVLLNDSATAATARRTITGAAAVVDTATITIRNLHDTVDTAGSFLRRLSTGGLFGLLSGGSR